MRLNFFSHIFVRSLRGYRRAFASSKWLRPRRRGFSVIEVMVALTVLTVALVGILALTNYSLGLSRVARQELIAANLAQEGVEIVHSLRDKNWLASRTQDSACAICPCTGSWRDGLCNASYEFEYFTTAVNQVTNAFTVPGNRLNISSASGLYSYGAGTATPFRREIRIAPPSSGNTSQSMLVTVVVRWCPGALTPVPCSGVERSLTVQDQLYNWYGR